MPITDLLKQSTITCPGCNASFQLGPDLKSITEGAGKLLDQVAGLFGDNPHGALCEEIARHYDVAPDRAVALLKLAMNDSSIRDHVFDFIDTQF